MIQPSTPEIDQPGKREIIRDWFLTSIRTGQLAPGQTVPTRFELADRFECARATADFVIKNLIKEKVLSAQRGKGTFVLPPEEGNAIDAFALINCNATFSWSAEIEEGFVAGVGQKVKITRFIAEELHQPMNWKFCKQHRTLVFIMPEAENSSFLQNVRNHGISHLVLYRDPPESPFVNVDHRAAGRAMVAALKARGCRKIAWVSRTESRFKTPEERYTGILEGLLEQGLPFKKEWAGFFHADEEKRYLASLFSGPERPDALVLGQSYMGQVLKAIQAAGFSPGKEITIAQMDETKTGLYPFPILCAERLTRQIGQEAARILLQNGKTAGAPVLRQYLTPSILEV